jgi:putative NADH-flavin reductase
MHIFMLGATGRVGSKALELALSDGHHVHALVRDATRLKMQHERLHLYIGDARVKEHLSMAMQGTELIFSALSTDGTDVLSTCTPVLLELMQAMQIRRIVVISTAGILQSRSSLNLLRYQAGESRRSLSQAVLEHYKAWTYYEASSLDWTIVCPTYLPDGEATGQFRAEINYLPLDGTSISVGDTAVFSYQQLFSNTYIRQRVGLAY